MDMLKRPVNTGYSGGEKKRHEVLQMALLQPTLCDPGRDRTSASTSTRIQIAAGRRERDCVRRIGPWSSSPTISGS